MAINLSTTPVSFIQVNSHSDNSGNTYTLTKDVTITELIPDFSLNTYFQLSEYDIFDGNGYTIDYEGKNTEGIFDFSGTYIQGDDSNYPIVRNVGVLNGNIVYRGGGIIRKRQKFFKVEKCYNTGIISGNEAGGIAGFDDGFYGECHIINCYNTGIISGENSGGIASQGAGAYGICHITNCYNTGIISDNYSGGIVGRYAGYNGECHITNCYNTSIISGNEAGGIAGSHAGMDGECHITNCYNVGDISGNNAGGIAGSYAGIYGECHITNCYNTGEISGEWAGGIAGNSAGKVGTCHITNCFTADITDADDFFQYVGDIVNPGSISVSGSGNISSLYVSDWKTNTTLNSSGAYLSRVGVNSGEVIPYLKLDYSEEIKEFHKLWHVFQLRNTTERIPGVMSNSAGGTDDLRLMSNVESERDWGNIVLYAPTPSITSRIYQIGSNIFTLYPDGSLRYNSVRYGKGREIVIAGVKVIVGSATATTEGEFIDIPPDILKNADYISLIINIKK